jgi:hypothetical protein
LFDKNLTPELTPSDPKYPNPIEVPQLIGLYHIEVARGATPPAPAIYAIGAATAAVGAYANTFSTGVSGNGFYVREANYCLGVGISVDVGSMIIVLPSFISKGLLKWTMVLSIGAADFVI